MFLGNLEPKAFEERSCPALQHANRFDTHMYVDMLRQGNYRKGGMIGRSNGTPRCICSGGCVVDIASMRMKHRLVIWHNNRDCKGSTNLSTRVRGSRVSGTEPYGPISLNFLVNSPCLSLQKSSADLNKIRRGTNNRRNSVISSGSIDIAANHTSENEDVIGDDSIISKPLNRENSVSRFASSFPNTKSQSMRDEEGRSLAGTKKPLKINLDLGLYRARQTRIRAGRARTLEEEKILLREAEVMLKRCLQMDPEDGRAYVILGKILLKQRRFDEAVSLYESGSAATGGTNAHIWTAWAYLANMRGDIALARKLYDAAIVADPTHAAAYHGWGLLEKKQGEFARARDIWVKGIRAVELSSASPYLFQSLAVLASELQKPDEARKWFQTGIQTVSGPASHALWHAWALMEQGQGSNPEVIRELYSRGLASSPRSRYIFLSFALWEKQQGNISEARRLFKAGTYQNKKDAALLQAWALMEENCKNIDQARRLFKRASRANPHHLYVWQAWGCMEQRVGNLDAARECFQQGIWTASPRDPDLSLVFQAWAVLESTEKNIDLARELFKCAVKANPRSEPSWLAWADMEEDLGDPLRARELRGFSMQEKMDIISPPGFSTIPAAEKQGILAPFFGAVNKWFQRYEEASKSHTIKGKPSQLDKLLQSDCFENEFTRNSNKAENISNSGSSENSN